MTPYSPHLNDVLLLAPPQDGWLLFRDPIEILIARKLDDVIPVLDRVDEALRDQDAYAAGFIAYEAAAGLDPALKAKPLHSFPLVWFGLYQKPLTIPTLPAAPDAVSGSSLLSWTASVDRANYDTAIDRIKQYIAQGKTYQVNYTFRLTAPFQQDPLKIFIDLVKAQKAPYAAFVNTERFTLCSASPELFFSLDGKLIASRPMKGTAARGRTLQEDLEQASWLRNSAKNQAENVMIVDMARNDIGKIADIGSVKVQELYSVEKYPTVWQMVSTVTGETRAGLREIFRALFPPASITGAPKARTMEIILELETSPRGIYTGCIGFISPDRKAQFNVAIRTLLIDKAEARAEYGVGGGITWDSIDSAEFEEAQTKAKILSVRIPGFSLLESLLWTPEGGYFLLDLHLARLADSAAFFSFPVEINAVKKHLLALAGDFGQGPQKVRLLLDECGRITSQTENLRLTAEQRPLRLCLARNPVDPADPFLYHKTTHRRVYEQARASCPEEQGRHWDDILLWNGEREVTEACTANVLVDLDGVLVTPPVSCGLLAGTYRAWLLEQGKIKEKIIKLDDLLKSPRVYLINSVRKQREAQVFFPEAQL
jgi:para-aminobenzoate synthetase/4-amino-4-deoxychorismate lyase